MCSNCKVKQFAISDHLSQCYCTTNFDEFDILAADCNEFKLLLRDGEIISARGDICSVHFSVASHSCTGELLFQGDCSYFAIIIAN